MTSDPLDHLREERMTVKEFAQASGYSRQTIHTWINEGALPERRKIGRRLYFMTRDVLPILTRMRTVEKYNV